MINGKWVLHSILTFALVCIGAHEQALVGTGDGTHCCPIHEANWCGFHQWRIARALRGWLIWGASVRCFQLSTNASHCDLLRPLSSKKQIVLSLVLSFLCTTIKYRNVAVPVSFTGTLYLISEAQYRMWFFVWDFWGIEHRLQTQDSIKWSSRSCCP